MISKIIKKFKKVKIKFWKVLMKIIQTRVNQMQYFYKNKIKPRKIQINKICKNYSICGTQNNLVLKVNIISTLTCNNINNKRNKKYVKTTNIKIIKMKILIY